MNLASSKSNIKMIIFDFDGTLIKSTVSLELAKKLGFYKEMKKLQEKVLAREIELEKGLKIAYDYFKGYKYNIIINYAKEVEWLKGVNKTIEALKSKGYILAVISIGTPENIIRDLTNYKGLNFDYIFGNKISVENGIITNYITGELMNVRSKMSVLRKLLSGTSIRPENCAAVADDIFNIPLFKLVSFRIAINAQEPLKKFADVVIETDDLREILPYF